MNMEHPDVLKAPPDSTNSDLAGNAQEVTDNDSGSLAQSNNSVSTSPSMSKSIPFRDPYLPEDDGSILTPEHAFVQYQTRSEDQACQICGQPAVGFHHRAYVCEACKKFFMRHTAARYRNSEAGGPSPAESVCPLGGQCRVEGPGRGKCPHCRYRKCLDLGMTLTPPGGESGCDISQIPCRVCGGPSSGFHFGALTCEGCKGFFRRTVLSSVRLECLSNNDCPITPANRNMCKSCRFQRCLAVGMSKSGSRIGRQPNAIKYYCAREISQLSSTGEADGAPSSSSSVPNGRGQQSVRPRTSSVSSSDGDKNRSPTMLGRLNNSSWSSPSDHSVQPAQSSTDHGSSASSTSNGQSLNSLNSTGKSTLISSMRRFSADHQSIQPPDSSPKSLGSAGSHNNNSNNISNNSNKKRKSLGHVMLMDASGLSVVTGQLEADRDRLKYAPTQAVAFREAHSSSSIPPGSRMHELAHSRGSRDWYVPFSQASGDAGGYDRGLRMTAVSMDNRLSHAPTLEYSLPNPDMSSHISSTTSVHDMQHSPSVELDADADDGIVNGQTNGQMLSPLAVHLPMDECSDDPATGYKSFASRGRRPADAVTRREPSSTFAYSPSFAKDDTSTTGLYPFQGQANRRTSGSENPRHHSLLSTNAGLSTTHTATTRMTDDEAVCALEDGGSSSRSTRSIVDHLTSTVLQFRQQQQHRLGSVGSDSPLSSTKLSGSPPLDNGPNTSRHARLSGLTNSSDENDGTYPAPSDSPSSQTAPSTRMPTFSGHHTYPLPSSCKPASPEFAWHQQQQPHHPKQRYIKSNGSPLQSGLEPTHFRAPAPGSLTPKYYDLSPRSLNGSLDHSPAVTAALCAAAAAEVTSSTSSPAPWFAAAAAAAAMANVLMVASQAPSSCSNDPYQMSAGGSNGCQTELTGCRRGTLPTSTNFAKRLKVAGSESPLSVDSSSILPISTVTQQQQFEQYVNSLAKCDANTVLRSLQLPSHGIDARSSTITPTTSTTSRLTHPTTVAAMRAAAAAAAAAAATAAGLVLSNSGVRTLPADELVQMHRTTAAATAAAALSTFPNYGDPSSNASSSSPSPPPSASQFGRVAEAPMVYGSLEPRPTANLPRKESDLVRTKNGVGALFITIQEFASGIQVAAKYLITERKKIRANLPPPFRPMQMLERIEDVWDRMMQHFEYHSRFIVHFVKLIPGFNHLELSDKRQLVRGAMYPLMLLELSRDYVNKENSQYNYFDFTESEREVILKHFPTFRAITGHLIRSGEFLHRVRLDNIELALVCAQEVFKNQTGLIDPTSTGHLHHLATCVLTDHIIDSGQPLEERSSMLRLISPLLEELNLEHHQVISQLKQEKPQLDFPELYTEMFQLSEADEREQQQAAMRRYAESGS